MGGKGNINVRRSDQTFKPPDRLASVPYFWKNYLIFAGPSRKEPPKPRMMTTEEMDLNEDYNPDDDK